MHPLDTIDRRPMIKEEVGIGYCNITRCCTEVCPEHIVITDNAIIPLKERVADDFYDPVRMIANKIFPPKHKKSLPVFKEHRQHAERAIGRHQRQAGGEDARRGGRRRRRRGGRRSEDLRPLELTICGR